MKRIVQQKSDKELMEKTDKIIDSLKEFNVAEKYKIICCLYNSLVDTLKEQGIIIVGEKVKKK